MEEITFKAVLWGYVKQKCKVLILFAIFSLLFFVVIAFYQLHAEAVLYATALCLSVGLIWGIVDFCYYYKRHKVLYEMRDKVDVDIEKIPLPHNLIEQDYMDLISAVHKDKIRRITEYDHLTSDMIDYYTMWAHQIKTPIAAMRLLLQTEENTNNKELLSELFKIEQYVEMVLSYLRLDSNSTDFVIRQYPIESIVKQAVRKYAPLFIRKKIRLDLKPMDQQVLTDEKWLVFVIEQILSNALKYTSKGKITISMEGKTLLISDTGIGIAEDDLPRVCEKGFTGYNGRTDKRASGIGLYLCKRILTKLSHTIAIESAVGRGTTVKIGLDELETL